MYNQQQQQAASNGQGIVVQGRIVWTCGDLFTGKVKLDERTKQPVIDPKTGEKVIEYGFGLAIPKMLNGQHHPEYVKIYQALRAEALTLFPGGQIPQGFSMKYKDGDNDVDPSGTPYSQREGHAGHIILACTTRIPIKYFLFEGGNNIIVNNGFKCGDYVNVQLSLKAHPAVGQGKAGIYVNPSAVQMIQPGKEIINTPSGDQLFGTNAPSYSGEIVPHAAGTMPGMMPTMGGQPQQNQMSGMPGMNQPQQNQMSGMPPMGGQPQQNQMSGMPPMGGQQQQAAPNYGVLPGHLQPSQPQQNQMPMNNGMPGMNQMGGMPPMGNQQAGQNLGQTTYPSNNGMPPMGGQQQNQMPMNNGMPGMYN